MPNLEALLTLLTSNISKLFLMEIGAHLSEEQVPLFDTGQRLNSGLTQKITNMG